ncbi:hypothetical protein ACIQNU_33775 [Streptomyces sp. NPDC091292]|uniref:hypothetical protein n=1 Tax=Streptomyces sp. NPDC091292 TaxID=3365991 RepID=UPI0037F3BA7F
MIKVITVRHGGGDTSPADPAGTALALGIARTLHGPAARAAEVSAPTARKQAARNQTARNQATRDQTARKKARRDAARDRRRTVRG